MTNRTTQIKKKPSDESSSEKQKGIDGHKKIANQLSEASELHLAAAAYLEDGDQVGAFHNAVSAYGMISLARESQQLILDHSLNGKVLF
jgi:hypothetical protein